MRADSVVDPDTVRGGHRQDLVPSDLAPDAAVAVQLGQRDLAEYAVRQRVSSLLHHALRIDLRLFWHPSNIPPNDDGKPSHHAPARLCTPPLPGPAGLDVRVPGD